VVVEPSSNKPIVAGTVWDQGTGTSDLIAVKWDTSLAPTTKTTKFYGEKYDNDHAYSVDISSNGRVYIVGATARPESVTYGDMPELPCGEDPGPGPWTPDLVGAMRVEDQALIVSAFPSNLAPDGSPYYSNYSRLEQDGHASATSSGVYATYDHVDVPASLNAPGYVDVYRLQ
jgi:hypothetical protein